MYQHFVQHPEGAQIVKTCKCNLTDYKDEVVYISEVEKDGKSLYVISNMLRFQSHVPYQAKMLPERMVLFLGVKTLVACPNVWLYGEGKQVGDLFMPLDHANISTIPCGNGVNVAECGPRFYDISTMYHKDLREKAAALAAEKNVSLEQGYLLWINHMSVPSYGHQMHGKALETDKIKFSGIVQDGVGEIFALCHWRSEKPVSHLYKSLMIGVASDSVSQVQDRMNEKWQKGVQQALDLVWNLV